MRFFVDAFEIKYLCLW